MSIKMALNRIKVTFQIIWEIVLIFIFGTYIYVGKFCNLFLCKRPKSLDGEIILLTGSGNGIGKQIARELANQGAILVCWDYEAEANNRTVEELRRCGTKAFAYTVDISQRQNIVTAANKVRSEVGDVTIVINNAGVAPNGPFLEAADDVLEKVFQVNIISHMWILRQFLPRMIERGHGHVVTVASMAGFFPIKNFAAYAATKHAVIGFIDTLRQEMLVHPKKPDIKFTTAYPIFVQTRLLDGLTVELKYKDIQRITPEYVAKKIVEGFRQNDERLVLPPSLTILPFITNWLPEKLMKRIQDGFF